MAAPASRHLVSAADLSKPEIEALLDRAGTLAKNPEPTLLAGQILVTMFYEPSTRTRLSFESAMTRLGGHVLSVADATGSSSAVKGETIEDTIRVLESYGDILAVRHPEEGSVARAAAVSSVPIINAGDGSGEHPTQALLDLYAMRQETGKLGGLRVCLVGDLKFGRTVHSLVRLLSHWKVELTLVSPPELDLPPDILSGLPTQPAQERDLATALKGCDLVYMTRIQQERFSDPADYEKHRGAYVLTADMVRSKPDLVVLHPLPRVDEIEPDVDSLPNAAYFRQAAGGVHVRMALLATMLGR